MLYIVERGVRRSNISLKYIFAIVIMLKVEVAKAWQKCSERTPFSFKCSSRHQISSALLSDRRTFLCSPLLCVRRRSVSRQTRLECAVIAPRAASTRERSISFVSGRDDRGKERRLRTELRAKRELGRRTSTERFLSEEEGLEENHETISCFLRRPFDYGSISLCHNYVAHYRQQ